MGWWTLRPAVFVAGAAYRAARGSLAELDTLVEAAVRLGFLQAEEMKTISERLVELRRILQGLISSLGRMASS